MNRDGASVWLIALAIAVASSAAGWVAANGIRQPQHNGTEVTTTIEQILSRPNDFAGKRIRLIGQLDECYHWECSLCPNAMTNKSRNADRCLALSFRPLINGTGFGSNEQERVFRFSSVILTATFDPSCWKRSCLDRQTVLEDANVVAVTKRRAGAAGLWITDTNKLTLITGPEAAEIRSAALRAGYPENLPIRAFTTNDPAQKLVVCWSSPVFDDQDLGAWPTTLEGALYAESTLDFFQCNEVRETGGQMVVQAQA